jgi:transcription initiation factor TFIID subunit 6
LQPELSLHWLAIDGNQPLIPENPTPATATQEEGDDQPITLPKEMQHFYSRLTTLLSACEDSNASLPAVFDVLRSDAGIQDLVPYFSRFIYRKIKTNTTKSLTLMRVLVNAIWSLTLNPRLRMEFHLQQLLPAIFTCIVANKLSSSPSDDHWQLRSFAAELVASMCKKYGELFPDLQARVCKTYMDALALGEVDDRKKTLATLYGGLVGLSSLGHSVVRTLIVPNIGGIIERINNNSGGLKPTAPKGMNEDNIAIEKCRWALIQCLG